MQRSMIRDGKSVATDAGFGDRHPTGRLQGWIVGAVLGALMLSFPARYAVAAP